ncbi:MAG: hypothetical protein OXN97_06585 [Bryobacterales bacterium]|nr:hypothetical protein [Bryobacterales bacterium]MDE0629512.1 hypothetical protein [Bryobacterales bacterium]
MTQILAILRRKLSRLRGPRFIRSGLTRDDIHHMFALVPDSYREPAHWRLDVRIRGHWTACGLYGSSAAALREGLRQLARAREIRLVSQSVSSPGQPTLLKRYLVGAGSLRITDTREETA